MFQERERGGEGERQTDRQTDGRIDGVAKRQTQTNRNGRAETTIVTNYNYKLPVLYIDAPCTPSREQYMCKNGKATGVLI